MQLHALRFVWVRCSSLLLVVATTLLLASYYDNFKYSRYPSRCSAHRWKWQEFRDCVKNLKSQINLRTIMRPCEPVCELAATVLYLSYLYLCCTVSSASASIKESRRPFTLLTQVANCSVRGSCSSTHHTLFLACTPVTVTCSGVSGRTQLQLPLSLLCACAMRKIRFLK